MPDEVADPDFMTSLARGLDVMRCFAERPEPMTVAEASKRTGLSRSAVRRCLHTLAKLGYAAQVGQSYALRPKTLSLGHAYLSSDRLAIVAQPVLDQLRDGIGESCSLGVRDGDELFYIARSPAAGIMTIALTVGSRLPLYCTSMGRVLLAAAPRPDVETYLDRVERTARTERTQTDRRLLADILDRVREEGFAIVDQELELGLRSVAVPVFDRNQQVVAALNVGTQAARIPLAELRQRILPALRRGSRDLSMLGL